MLIATVSQLPHSLTRTINSFTKAIAKRIFSFVVQKITNKFSNFKFKQWSNIHSQNQSIILKKYQNLFRNKIHFCLKKPSTVFEKKVG